LANIGPDRGPGFIAGRDDGASCGGVDRTRTDLEGCVAERSVAQAEIKGAGAYWRE